MGETFQQKAMVVYERSHGFHNDTGPYECGKIGVAFGSEVFWTGSYNFPGDVMEGYNLKVAFATEIANRWNAQTPE